MKSLILDIFCSFTLLALVISTAAAQNCSPGTNDENFFTFCQAGTSYTYNGDYTIDMGQGGNLEINGDVTINGTLTINYVGNTGTIHIQTGKKLKATNVVFTNNNPVKVKIIDVDGTFEVTGNLNFSSDLFDLDGTGSVSAGSITGAGNVSCSTEGDCPGVSAGSCGPTNSGICSEPGTVTLPIVLKDFVALVSEEAVELTWTTTKEESFEKFVVERSKNGADFEEIGVVEGAGFDFENQEKEYSFVDQAPFSGQNYYRLKTIDLDETATIYRTVAVKIQVGNKVSIYPNPGSGNSISFKLNFEPSVGDRVILFDRVGSELLNVKVTVSGGVLNPQQKLQQGIYYLKYDGADFSQTVQVIIKD